MFAPLIAALLVIAAIHGGQPAAASPTTAGAAFVRDFRRDFPELSHRGSSEILADSDAIAAAIRSGLRWDVLLAKVDARFHAGDRGPEVLSLISCLMQAPIRH